MHACLQAGVEDVRRHLEDAATNRAPARRVTPDGRHARWQIVGKGLAGTQAIGLAAAATAAKDEVPSPVDWLALLLHACIGVRQLPCDILNVRTRLQPLNGPVAAPGRQSTKQSTRSPLTD
jgi:hypothetical protein